MRRRTDAASKWRKISITLIYPTPPSIQAAGMLNMPVAIFAHPLYHLMQGTVRKRELVTLLIGVIALWSYIGWRIDKRTATPRPNSCGKSRAALECASPIKLLICSPIRREHERKNDRTDARNVLCRSDAVLRRRREFYGHLEVKRSQIEDRSRGFEEHLGCL